MIVLGRNLHKVTSPGTVFHGQAAMEEVHGLAMQVDEEVCNAGGLLWPTLLDAGVLSQRAVHVRVALQTANLSSCTHYEA